MERANAWAHAHGKTGIKAPLPKSLENLYEVWFTSLDTENRGTIGPEELISALTVSDLPSERSTVLRLLKAMDTDGSGHSQSRCCPV
jgi:Ca2+-binding EF-hand superfamily protein